MSNGWKTWFTLLASAAVLVGAYLTRAAFVSQSVNENFATGAPQQTVIGLWTLRDLAVVLIMEAALGVVVVASYAVWRGSVGREAEVSSVTPNADEPTGRHAPPEASDQ